jgi:glycosyltransferase involved in cell wall biosynthesis
MAHKLHQIGFNPDKIINIPYGVPMNEFRPVEKDFNDVFRFLSVGRFVPKKSPLNTVKAFEHCADHNPNVALTMIGDGPLFEQAACYIEKSKHKDKIRLEGAQPQAIVREALDKAHVFVQHSVTSEKKDTEGWPVAIAEACACALPVVATAHAGIKDQIVHGETGYLVPEGSFIGMGEYMLQFSRNADLCRRMGKQGRQYMEKYGDFRLQAEKLKTVLTASYSDG